MFCSKCQNELRENAKFCHKCGTKISLSKNIGADNSINVISEESKAAHKVQKVKEIIVKNSQDRKQSELDSHNEKPQGHVYKNKKGIAWLRATIWIFIICLFAVAGISLLGLFGLAGSAGVTINNTLSSFFSDKNQDIQSNSVTSICPKGYFWGEDSKNCISYDEACASSYPNSRWSGTGDECDCRAGFAWDDRKMACIIEGILKIPGALKECPQKSCKIIRYYAETAEVAIIGIDQSREWYEVKAKDDYGNYINGWMHYSLFSNDLRNEL